LAGLFETAFALERIEAFLDALPAYVLGLLKGSQAKAQLKDAKETESGDIPTEELAETMTFLLSRDDSEMDRVLNAYQMKRLGKKRRDIHLPSLNKCMRSDERLLRTCDDAFTFFHSFLECDIRLLYLKATIKRNCLDALSCVSLGSIVPLSTPIETGDENLFRGTLLSFIKSSCMRLHALAKAKLESFTSQESKVLGIASSSSKGLSEKEITACFKKKDEQKTLAAIHRLYEDGVLSVKRKDGKSDEVVYYPRKGMIYLMNNYR